MSKNKTAREKTKIINIKHIKIGGGNPVIIQSMTNQKKINNIIKQINQLADAGCEIIRCAVPDFEMADALKIIKSKTKIPIVADIHFDYKLAIESIKNGADKIRINPGNINSRENIKLILNYAKKYHVPIRIGVNSGSLDKTKYKHANSNSLVQSALDYINLFNSYDFDNIILSVKSSCVTTCVKAYKLLSQKTNYPLHIGITESGISPVKSSVGLGIILHAGIGDTIRVSLADNPLKEIQCAQEILSALNLRRFGIEFIICPTCARTQINLIKIANQVKNLCIKNNFIHKKITVAIMGCAVNGPGEAQEADIGIAGGKNSALLFSKGKIIKQIPEADLVQELIKQIALF